MSKVFQTEHKPKPNAGFRVTMSVEAHSPDTFEWAMRQAFELGNAMFMGVETGGIEYHCGHRCVLIATPNSILEIAKRGELDPESLTPDEIRAIRLYVLAQTGEPIEPKIENLN